MPVTYTNRKGFTYYLCRGVTKTGKPRYNYRVNVRPKRIEMYETVGPDAATFAGELSASIPILPGMSARLTEQMERCTQFPSVLRFTLIDADHRRFL